MDFLNGCDFGSSNSNALGINFEELFDKEHGADLLNEVVANSENLNFDEEFLNLPEEEVLPPVILDAVKVNEMKDNAQVVTTFTVADDKEAAAAKAVDVLQQAAEAVDLALSRGEEPATAAGQSVEQMQVVEPQIKEEVVEEQMPETVTTTAIIPTVIQAERPTRMSKVKARNVARRAAEQDQDDDYTPSSIKPSKGKKRKLYEQPAFKSPEMERNRQNAINAKLNRERKKKEKDALVKQMEMLRSQNVELRDERDEALEEAARLRDILAANGLSVGCNVKHNTARERMQCGPCGGQALDTSVSSSSTAAETVEGAAGTAKRGSNRGRVVRLTWTI